MVFPASATPEAKARTRAFARVIGPFLVIVPGIIVVRAPEMDTSVSAFFENGALVWIVGGLLLFCGLLIIAHHQYWSSAAAILISLSAGFWRFAAWRSWPRRNCISVPLPARLARYPLCGSVSVRSP
jgi:hypothetical protein